MWPSTGPAGAFCAKFFWRDESAGSSAIEAAKVRAKIDRHGATDQQMDQHGVAEIHISSAFLSCRGLFAFCRNAKIFSAAIYVRCLRHACGEQAGGGTYTQN
jgi:hypothetical protein